MTSVFGFVHRNWQALLSPPEVAKTPNALRFGILGAASIAPFALIKPAKSHPDVIIQAVAARDKKKATAYAKKHGIPQVLDSYEAIINDPSIDAVYIPLPNGLHYEWALKALAKGKHVLLEKPSASNATEAESLFRSPLLQKPGAPVLLEAVHSLFQPAWQYFLTLIDRPNLDHAYAASRAPSFAMPLDDIRFRYDLGGGSIMDMGTYQTWVLRGIFGAEPEACTECVVRKCPPPNELCDEAAHFKFRFPGGAIGEGECDLRATGTAGFSLPIARVTHKETPVADDKLPAGQEKFRVRKLVFHNYMVSTPWHRIDIEDDYVIRNKDGGAVVKKWSKKESKKIYTFKDAGVVDQPSEPFWMSYRHQLEQFVNRVRGRQGSGLWIDADNSIAQAKALDMVYEKSELPLRPTSSFKLDDDPATTA